MADSSGEVRSVLSRLLWRSKIFVVFWQNFQKSVCAIYRNNRIVSFESCLLLNVCMGLVMLHWRDLYFQQKLEDNDNLCVLYLQLIETGHPGQFRLWALIGNDLHAMKLNIPRIFYVNQKSPKVGEGQSKYTKSCVIWFWNKCLKLSKNLEFPMLLLHLVKFKMPSLNGITIKTSSWKFQHLYMLEDLSP